MAVEDDAVVGTAASIRHAPGVYQLAKMTVASSARERGVGRCMLSAVLDKAKLMGAHRLFLGSSTKLEKAVRLYESIGFQHVRKSNIPELEYARASVFMEMNLGDSSNAQRT